MHGGGPSKHPPVFMELQSSGGTGAFKLMGDRRTGATGILWTCYSGNISALDRPHHFLINEDFWPVALQRNGKDAHTHLGIENHCNIGSQRDGEMKSAYKMGARTE